MSWDLPKIEKDGTIPELHVTSFFGGQNSGRCLQISQRIDGDNSHQFVQLTRTQLLQLLQRFEDWDSGKLNEADSCGSEQ